MSDPTINQDRQRKIALADAAADRAIVAYMQSTDDDVVRTHATMMRQISRLRNLRAGAGR